MHRNNLLALLDAYPTSTAFDAATRARFIAFVQTHPECFERALQIGHVTGSAWVVDASGARTLLTHHRKLNKWLQLGGHADGNPDILAVALREAREESGLTALQPVSSAIFDLDLHTIPAHGHEPAHEHYDVRFALQAVGSEALVVSAESHDVQWVAITRLARFSQDEALLRMGRKWLAQCRP